MNRQAFLMFLLLLVPMIGSEKYSNILPAQSMRDVYRIDFLTYENQGDQPLEVAQYWNEIGASLIRRLQDGEHFDLPDREKVLAELIDLYDSAQSEKEIMNMVLLAIREQNAISSQQNRKIARNIFARAEKTFSLIGPALSEQLVQQKLKEKLPDFFMRREKDPTLLADFVSYDSLRKAIGVSDEQQAKIERFTAHAAKEFKVEAEETIAKIRIQTDAHWASLLEKLSEEERNKLVEACGEPTDWYAEFDWPQDWGPENTSARHRAKRKGQFFYGSEIKFEMDDDGKWPHEKSQAELADSGIIKADRGLVKLIDEPMVQGYLELDLEQQEGWRLLRERYRKKGILYYEQNRAAALKNPAGELYPPEITALLSASQIRDLKWLEYQARSGGQMFNIAREILPPKVSRKLYREFRTSLPNELRKLLSEPYAIRKSKIRQRLKDGIHFPTGPINARLAFKLAQLRDAIEESLGERIRGVLTTSQIEQFQNMVARQPGAGSG